MVSTQAKAGEVDQRLARSLVDVMNEFRALEPDITANLIMMFFMVAERPGIRLKDLEKATGLARSGVSRGILNLSTQNWRKGPDGKFLPGLDLVSTATDPFDPRAKVAALTPRGRRLFERVSAMVEHRVPPPRLAEKER